MTETWTFPALLRFGETMTKIAKDPIHVGGAYTFQADRAN